MAKSTNKCFFTGRLGKDPESRRMPSGDQIVSFSIAVADDYKDKSSGQNVEKTEWVNLKATGKLAEICERYLKKGSRVLVEAKFETRKYQHQGVEKLAVEFLIRDMEMLDSRPADQGNSQPAGPRSRPMPEAHRQPAGDLDDMIPF